MRFRPVIFAGLISLLLATETLGQDARPVFNFLLNQLDQQLSNEQRRLNQQQQQEIIKQNGLAFIAAWHACFNNNDLGHCDIALQYPYLQENDQQRLFAKRAEISSAYIEQAEQQKAAAAQAAQQQQDDQQAAENADKEAERKRLEAEQAKIAAEEQRIAKQQIDGRIAADRARDQLAAEQRKQADFKDAAIETKHRADVAAMFKACFNGDLVICDAVEQMPLSTQERTDLAGIRQSLTGKSASTQ